MKSRTSFFNGTVFQKDVRRFAPSWGLYSVVLLMGFVTVLGNGTIGYYRASAVADLTPYMALLNFCYAFINAQLLFGDLFNARLCNALHAMPLRRECWYSTHLAAGLGFSVVPNLAVCLLGLLTLGLGKAWSVALWWLLASTLQYLFFFGAAVFCMMLTGNRFAAALIYAIVNFFALLVYWLLDSLYEPLLVGIRFSSEPFEYFSPLVAMTDNHYLVDVVGERIEDLDGNFVEYLIQEVTLGEGWGSLAVYALVGAALLVLGRMMYRRRDLETAGDFAAFKFAEPVLQVIYTMTVGGFLHLFAEIFGSSWEQYLFLAVGLVVGWFTGLMLLQRTTRVFSRKAFLRLGLLVLVFSGTLVVTWLDPLGITRWVPDAGEVASVNLSSRYERSGYSEGELTLTSEEDIANMIAIHRNSIGRDSDDEMAEYGVNYTVNFCVEYTMRDGSVKTRFYDVNAASAAGQLLKGYYSSFEYVTGFTEEEIPEVAERINYLYTQQLRDNTDEYRAMLEGLDMEGLLRSIAADCAAGNMAQYIPYHMVLNEYGGWERCDGTFLEIGTERIGKNTGEWSTFYSYLTVYEDAEHTMNWMIENGLYDPNYGIG